MSSNLLLFVACILSSLGCLASEVPSGKEIRTYMPFTFPVDPAKIHTIPDLNIALALNRTLIERDEEKELSAGLAESWKSISPETVRLTLNSKVKWSDGKIISAEEIKQSIERSLKVHPADGRGLISILEKIVCPTQREIDFKLKSPGLTTQLLTKLADAKLGVVKIKENGQMDLSVTSGPFSMLPTSTQTQLILKRNPSENASSSKSPYVQRIIIRKPPQNMESPKVLLEDNWPNLSESTSLATPDLAQRYENQGLEIWKTPLDKLFYQIGRAHV